LLEAGASPHDTASRSANEGKLLEPIAGQFVFDFSLAQQKVVSSAPVTPMRPEPAEGDVADCSRVHNP